MAFGTGWKKKERGLLCDIILECLRSGYVIKLSQKTFTFFLYVLCVRLNVANTYSVDRLGCVNVHIITTHA